MPGTCLSSFEPLESAARRSRIRDRMLLALTLYALVRAAEAMASDQASLSVPTLHPDFGTIRISPVQLATPVALTAPAAAPLLPAPGTFAVPPIDDKQEFSETEFRPRKHSSDHEAYTGDPGESPMLKSTTVWQRLSDYKSHDKVRLLTLWESSASTVSIQTTTHGDPSLQWTSRYMNRGGPTRGLFDRLFAVSLAGAGSSLRGMGHPNNSQTASKPAVSAVAAGPK
jgi:hypothetical protein